VKREAKANFKRVGAALALAWVGSTLTAAEMPTNFAADAVAAGTNNAAAEKSAEARAQNWNWHAQNTDIMQGDAAFPAKYSGPNSLPNRGEVRETISLDLMAGVRLWRGTEAHVDGLMWQGYGIGKTVGIEAFPSGEAYRAGTTVPNGSLARLFIRQTIGLGGEEESDDELHLAGKEDVSRLTFTLGRMSVIDIFDNNTYAGDPRTQFMNWAFISNEAWDYPADAIGYTTGLAVELNQPHWALRYGFFQMPGVQNTFTADDQWLIWPEQRPAGDGDFWRSWGMPVELEYRYQIKAHPGTIRFLAYVNQAHMASYDAAIAILQAHGDVPGTDTTSARAYSFKYGFGLNWEQEITQNIGIFSRLGWNDGQTESWAFTDVDRTGSLGLSVKGAAWHRPDDTFGLAGVVNAISRIHQEFFEDGGTGILAGDGRLNYGWEKALETYYDFKIWKTLHVAADYQYVVDPAYNRDRGPVSISGARLHWEF